MQRVVDGGSRAASVELARLGWGVRVWQGHRVRRDGTLVLHLLLLELNLLPLTECLLFRQRCRKLIRRQLLLRRLCIRKSHIGGGRRRRCKAQNNQCRAVTQAQSGASHADNLQHDVFRYNSAYTNHPGWLSIHRNERKPVPGALRPVGTDHAQKLEARIGGLRLDFRGRRWRCFGAEQAGPFGPRVAIVSLRDLYSVWVGRPRDEQPDAPIEHRSRDRGPHPKRPPAC